jgi:hypothetical protein
MAIRSAILALLCCAAAEGATILLQPSASTVSSGQVFSLEIRVSEVDDLFAFQFDLGYSQTVLEALSVAEGTFLSAGGSTLFIPGAIDNSSGLIAFTANTLLGEVPGVTGSGVVATVSFKAIGAGTSPINLFNVTLLDSSLSGTAPTIQNATVSAGGSVIPEPGGLQLMGTAVVLYALYGIFRLRCQRMSPLRLVAARQRRVRII